MKALVLAAGFGSRLLPYTEARPKPLFTINNEPVISLVINSLIRAGCSGIIVNTHHLHEQIASFIESRSFPVPVLARFEPEILGTGGAVRNVSDFLGCSPFFVVNSDIITDIDLKSVYDYHLSHDHPATLVMHDCSRFNKVAVDRSGFVSSFSAEKPGKDCSLLAFTGIQVLDPAVIDFIPEGQPSGIIRVYRSIMDSGARVKAFVPGRFYWQDIGTPERYVCTAFEHMAPEAFLKAFGFRPEKSAIKREKLAGDGSDRAWHRVSAPGRSLVAACHGIQARQGSETDSFIETGEHLLSKAIPVPEIYLYDRFAGLVFMQDLGDTLLHDLILRTKSWEEAEGIYRTVVSLMVQMGIKGKEGFDAGLACRNPPYDKDLILEKECRYFREAFLSGFLRMDTDPADLEDEFSLAADLALEHAVKGFMHRDFQSRNIMAANGKFYFIDFQGARTGPVQYDLASLLADPYVDLPEKMQEKLFCHALEETGKYIRVDEQLFRKCYQGCRLTRLLQVLGAFGYLTAVKGKPFFRQYIPAALRSLRRQLDCFPGMFPELKRTTDRALDLSAVLFHFNAKQSKTERRGTLMKPLKIMVNGLPGKVAAVIASRACTEQNVEVIPCSLTGPEIQEQETKIENHSFRLIKPADRDKEIDRIKSEHGAFICIDFTLPDAVNDNARFYCRHGIHFVMGTTGGDREELKKTISESSICAVIAPNMAKQIVGFQAMMEYAAENFPGLFENYSLEIRESHQRTKADTSGTAKAMVKYFNKLGVKFDEKDIVKIRDPEQQKGLGVPEKHLDGHGWHTYTLTSADQTVQFSFSHFVNGRDIYAWGTLDAARFLDAQAEAGKKGAMFSMIDVLRGAGNE